MHIEPCSWRLMILPAAIACNKLAGTPPKSHRLKAFLKSAPIIPELLKWHGSGNSCAPAGMSDVRK